MVPGSLILVTNLMLGSFALFHFVVVENNSVEIQLRAVSVHWFRVSFKDLV